MFALPGLILAFTYASGACRLDARKQAIPAEANALGTAFHRADLVTEPGRTTLKQTLLEYARSRMFTQEDLKSSNVRRKAIAGIQGRMSRWRMTTLTLVSIGLMKNDH